MYVTKVEDGKAYKTSLSPHIDKDIFCSLDNDYHLTEISINPDNDYDFIEGLVVINEEESLKKLNSRIKYHCDNVIQATNQYMLIDNPCDFSEQEISELISYRKSLKNATIEMPVAPSFLEELL